MPGFSYPVAILRGVPVVTAPAQIDIGGNTPAALSKRIYGSC